MNTYMDALLESINTARALRGEPELTHEGFEAIRVPSPVEFDDECDNELLWERRYGRPPFWK